MSPSRFFSFDVADLAFVEIARAIDQADILNAIGESELEKHASIDCGSDTVYRMREYSEKRDVAKIHDLQAGSRNQ